MSSMYWLQGWQVLHTLLNMLESCNLATNEESYILTIHDVKEISQEPSTSSKYGLRGWGVLDRLLESWNLTHKRITYYDHSWCQGSSQPPSTGSGTIKVFQLWNMKTRGGMARSLKKYRSKNEDNRGLKIYSKGWSINVNTTQAGPAVPTILGGGWGTIGPHKCYLVTKFTVKSSQTD